jgi:hypothetical protein
MLLPQPAQEGQSIRLVGHCEVRKHDVHGDRIERASRFLAVRCLDHVEARGA